MKQLLHVSAGILFLLASPILAYCCDTWNSVSVIALSGNCSTQFSFSYVECNSNAIYYVEYSTDGNTNDFYIIGQVTPNGSGSYSYTDLYAHPQSIGSANVFYRAIYYIPSTGYTHYSPIATVNLGSATCTNNNVTRCNGLPGFSISGANAVCAGTSQPYTISGTLNFPVTWSVSTNASYVTLTQNLTGANVNNSTNANNGIFTLVANEEGCDAVSYQVYLGIAPAPTVMTPAYGTTVHENSPYDIYSAPANNWTVTNGTILYGQGTNDLGVQVAKISSGTMTVTASVVDACGTSAQLIYNYPITGGGGGGGTRFTPGAVTGSNNSLDPASIKLGVYPNPVTNTVQVTIPPTDFTKATINLYDINGKLLKAIVPTNQTTLFDMSQQPKGIYIMEVFDGKQRTIQKVVRL
jgi:hypothetical protein